VAARHGLDAELLDPRSRTTRPAMDVVRSLVHEVEKALRELGDLDAVGDGVERVLRDGNGAARQRATLRKHELPGVLELITAAQG